VNGDMSAAARHLHPGMQPAGPAPEVLEELGIVSAANSVTPEEEIEQLRTENAELQQKIAKLEQGLKDTSGTAQFWAEQNKNTEKLLEEKSDLIRELHGKVQQLQSRPPVAAPQEEELLALGEELEEARRQLQEDEKALMQQMREMEIQMSRERAELARQRNELQRLHSEIRHELEVATREATLRDRLQPFQRRHQELLHRKGAEPPRETAPPPSHADVPESLPSPAPQKGSGFLRRFLGQGGE
jgi:chromosome segregation ATPase